MLCRRFSYKFKKLQYIITKVMGPYLKSVVGVAVGVLCVS